MNKPDHYSLLTVVLSFALGALSSLNAVAETYLPLISAVSIITSMSLTVWYYRAKIRDLKRHNIPEDRSQ